MIRVILTRDRLLVSGHAQSAPRGSDVVCAAVSALGQALLYGLQQVAGIAVQVEKWQDGRLDATWDSAALTPEADAIVATILGSLHEIETRYGIHLAVNRD